MKKPKSQHRAIGVPVFLYISACCNVAATKPPCVKVPPKERETNSLGSWRCGKCLKPCTVSRMKNSVDKKAD